MISPLSSPTLFLWAAGANTGDPTIDATTTGDKANILVPFKCEVIRAFVLLNAAPGDAGVVKFDKRPTYASDTGRGDGDVGVINLLTTHTAGKFIYKEIPVAGTGHVILVEGDEVIVEVTDASAAVTEARAGLLVREVPEVPGNNSDMVATT